MLMNGTKIENINTLVLIFVCVNSDYILEPSDLNNFQHTRKSRLSEFTVFVNLICKGGVPLKHKTHSNPSASLYIFQSYDNFRLWQI